MTQPLNSLFSLQEQALNVHGQRLRLLSSNLANADTPGFKARDIDFRAALDSASGAGDAATLQTHPDHLPVYSETAGAGETLYRVPLQPALDGNSVNPQIEKSSFSETSMRYESALEFLNRRISGLRSALRSE